jgi:hypothetical protein
MKEIEFKREFANLVAIINVAKEKFKLYLDKPFKINNLNGVTSLSFYNINYKTETVVNTFSNKINKSLSKTIIEDMIDVTKTIPIVTYPLSDEFLLFLDNNIIVKTNNKTQKIYLFKSLNDIYFNELDYTFEGSYLKKNKTGNISEWNKKLFFMNYFNMNSRDISISKEFLLSKTQLAHIMNIAHRKYFKNRTRTEIEDFISDTQLRVIQYICLFNKEKSDIKGFFLYVMKNIISSTNKTDYKKGNFMPLSLEIENEQGDSSQNTALISISNDTFNSDFNNLFDSKLKHNKKMFQLVELLPLSNQSKLIIRSMYNTSLIGNTSIQEIDERKKNQFKKSVLTELRKTFKKDISDASYRVYLTNITNQLKEFRLIDSDKKTELILNDYKNGEIELTKAYQHLMSNLNNKVTLQACK